MQMSKSPIISGYVEYYNGYVYIYSGLPLTFAGGPLSPSRGRTICTFATQNDQ
jgi:hypothetical protein